MFDALRGALVLRHLGGPAHPARRHPQRPGDGDAAARRRAPAAPGMKTSGPPPSTRSTWCATARWSSRGHYLDGAARVAILGPGRLRVVVRRVSRVRENPRAWRGGKGAVEVTGARIAEVRTAGARQPLQRDWARMDPASAGARPVPRRDARPPRHDAARARRRRRRATCGSGTRDPRASGATSAAPPARGRAPRSRGDASPRRIWSTDGSSTSIPVDVHVDRIALQVIDPARPLDQARVPHRHRRAAPR